MKVPVYEKKASRRDLLKYIEELRTENSKLRGQIYNLQAILQQIDRKLPKRWKKKIFSLPKSQSKPAPKPEEGKK